MPTLQGPKAFLEVWGVGDSDETEIDPITVDSARELIFGIQSEKSAVLVLEYNNLVLDIASSQGRFIVNLIPAEAEGKDLCLYGDQTKKGSERCIIAGQRTTRSRRFFVSADEALASATELIETGTIRADPERWGAYSIDLE